jgi:uncharacterized protein YbjT (DUF2867 family)
MNTNWRTLMYAITGITGKVGSIVARRLLQAGQPVRAVVRDAARGAPWAALGCEVAVAPLEDATALAQAFAGTAGVFLMTPPNFDPPPGFPQTREICIAVEKAARASRPGRIVFLSTVGAHVDEFNLLNNSRMTETMLRSLDLPTCMLRAAWFMENAAWDVEAARAGVIASFLQPLDHPIPMVATADIGAAAADLLTEQWQGSRVVELEGPRRYSARDIGAGFAQVLGHPVRLEPVPRDAWEAIFREQGMQFPQARIRMLDGFNEGWIDFEHDGGQRRHGSTTLDTVLAALSGVRPGQ